MPTFTTFIKLFVLFRVSLKTSRAMHHIMMIRVLHADLLTFYDQVPQGALTQRFTNDIKVID